MAFSFLSRNRDSTPSPATSARRGTAAGRTDGCIDSWTRSDDRPGWLVEGWCTDSGAPVAELGTGASKHVCDVAWVLRFSRPDAARTIGVTEAGAAQDRLGFVLFVFDEDSGGTAKKPSKLALKFSSLTLLTRTPALQSASRVQGIIAQAWSQSGAETRAALSEDLPAELSAAISKVPAGPAAEPALRRVPLVANPDLWGSLDSWVRIRSRPGYLVEGWCRATNPRVFLVGGGLLREGRIAWILRFARTDAAQVLGRNDGGADLGFVLFVQDGSGTPVDQIVIEQGGVGRAQRDENPQDEGRPQSAIAAAWSSRGRDLIERYGRTPPPEMLAAIAQPAAQIAGTVAFHIDHVNEVTGYGVLIGGWLIERVPGSTQLVLVDETTGAWADLSTGWDRIERADVMAEFEKRGNRPGHPPGFVTLARTPPMAVMGPRPYIEVGEDEDDDEEEEPETGSIAIYAIAVSGEVCRQYARPGRMRKTGDRIMTALNAVSGSPARAASVVAHHVGPAIEVWLQQEQGRSAIVRNDAFGAVATRAQTSIVVPVWGREDLIRAQLARMALDPELGKAVELIYVIDDVRLFEPVWQGARQWAVAYGMPFRLLATTGSVGYAAAVNLGSREANGEFLLTLDADCLPDRPGWLGPLMGALRMNPTCGAIGPKLLFGDDTVQSAGYRFANHPEIPGFISVADPERGQLDSPAASGAVRVDAVSGACLLTRRELFARVGGFETGFLFGHHEDAIYCGRLATLGFDTLLLPHVRLYHLEGVSRQARKSSEPMLADPIWRTKAALYNAWRLSRRLREVGSRA